MVVGPGHAGVIEEGGGVGLTGVVKEEIFCLRVEGRSV